MVHFIQHGNIGAGKTTLTKLLAKKYKFEGHYEEVLKNPYLDDFYDQKKEKAWLIEECGFKGKNEGKTKFFRKI
jgi:deoxyadenosine/deoxycytidine kinase